MPRQLRRRPSSIGREVRRNIWRPEHIEGWCARFGLLAISHETIYRRILTDRKRGGTLRKHLRVLTKKYRKRYGAYDSRVRLAGKRHISTRPPGASMEHLTQHDRQRIADKLNRRPRKRLGFKTPEEVYAA